MTEMLGVFLFSILLVIGMWVLYFLPAIIGFRRKKKNAAAILVVNLFLGWTLIGWVIALAWSVASDD